MLALISALVISITAVVTSSVYLEQQHRAPINARRDEALYLPHRGAVRFIAFGYNNALSNYLWFHTINYFGIHYRGDKDYRWLEHQCRLVTDLNPKVTDIYEFCSSMLAWETKEPRKGLDFLSTAIEHNPERWIYWYLRGVFHMFFFEDDVAAQADFVKAAGFPDAHPIVKRLAAKKIALSQGPETALQFLHFMIERSKSDAERNALKDRVKDVILERDLQRWNEALQKAHSSGRRVSSLEQLKQDFALDLPLVDPFGGHYTLDPESAAVRTTSTRKPLSERRVKRYNPTPSEAPK